MWSIGPVSVITYRPCIQSSDVGSEDLPSLLLEGGQPPDLLWEDRSQKLIFLAKDDVEKQAHLFSCAQFVVWMKRHQVQSLVRKDCSGSCMRLFPTRTVRNPTNEASRDSHIVRNTCVSENSVGVGCTAKKGCVKDVWWLTDEMNNEKAA